MIKKDSSGYSQMKGKYMFGKFNNNQLTSLNIFGNSEVVFYGRDEKQKLIGITKMKASKNIFITLDNNEINTIEFFVMPDGKTYPPSQLPESERILKGFIWREKERPVDKDAIFIRDKMQPEPANKLQNTVLKEKIED